MRTPSHSFCFLACCAFVFSLTVSLSFLWLCFISFQLCFLFCPLLWCNCCIHVTVLLYLLTVIWRNSNPFYAISVLLMWKLRKRNEHILQSLYINNRPLVKLRHIHTTHRPHSTSLIHSPFIYITVPFNLNQLLASLYKVLTRNCRFYYNQWIILIKLNKCPFEPTWHAFWCIDSPLIAIDHSCSDCD